MRDWTQVTTRPVTGPSYNTTTAKKGHYSSRNGELSYTHHVRGHDPNDPRTIPWAPSAVIRHLLNPNALFPHTAPPVPSKQPGECCADQIRLPGRPRYWGIVLHLVASHAGVQLYRGVSNSAYRSGVRRETQGRSLEKEDEREDWRGDQRQIAGTG